MHRRSVRYPAANSGVLPMTAIMKTKTQPVKAQCFNFGLHPWSIKKTMEYSK